MKSLTIRRQWNQILKLILVLTIILIGLGQNCSDPGDDGSLSPSSGQGNGDYYGGLHESELKKVTLEIEEQSERLVQISSESGFVDQPKALITAGSLNPIPTNRCMAVHDQLCSNKARMITYQGCEFGGRSHISLWGAHSTTYTQDACRISDANDRVHNQYFLTFVNTRNGYRATADTAQALDYRGQEIGGGEVVVKRSPGVRYEILGKHHRVIHRNAATLRDISQRTLIPIEFTNHRGRIDREIVAGSIETSHNLARYTSLTSYDRVQWNENCCYPVGGRISFEFSGTVNFKAQVQFKSCGQATIQARSQSADIELKACQ